MSPIKPPAPAPASKEASSQASSQASSEPSSDDPWERFFAHSPDLLCVVAPNGTFTRVSGAFANLGHEATALLARPFIAFVHPDDVTTTVAAFDRRGARVTPLAFEARFRCTDGTYRWVAWNGVPDSSGAVHAIGRDVTGTKANQAALTTNAEELRQANQFLDAIIENIPHMVFVKDAETLSFARFNRAGEALLGLSRTELLGKNDHDFFPPEEVAAFQKKDRETLWGKTLVDIPEEPIETKHGRRWLHTKKVPLLGDDGTPRYLLGISEDITDLKRLTETLAREKTATEVANRELEAFSYSVAHDLRAPLRSIDGFSQVLLEDFHDKLDDDGKKYLSFVREAAQRMGQLIDDLLTLSRVTRTELRRERVDLSALAHTVIERLRAESPQRRVDVVIQPGLQAQGDARLLAVVVENLLANAWKFTGKRASARVEFGLRRGEIPAQYFVSDDGAGFDPAYGDKLFGAFQRLHSAKEFEGTGVGLATVQRIVARHGGRVWAHGQPDAGATFSFTLSSEERTS